jgi:hypothetical protein
VDVTILLVSSNVRVVVIDALVRSRKGSTTDNNWKLKTIGSSLVNRLSKSVSKTYCGGGCINRHPADMPETYPRGSAIDFLSSMEFRAELINWQNYQPER